MRICLDDDACTGHGRCYELAPELFDADEEGHSVVLRADVPPGLEPGPTGPSPTAPRVPSPWSLDEVVSRREPAVARSLDMVRSRASPPSSPTTRAIVGVLLQLMMFDAFAVGMSGAASSRERDPAETCGGSWRGHQQPCRTVNVTVDAG